MDSERFGRALGFGARAAAKTLVTAIDAASAPSPSKPASPTAPNAPQRTATAQRPQPSGRGADVVQQVSRAAAQVKQTSEGVQRQGKHLQRSVWNPFVRLSGVLWLEFTGFFFGLFALTAGSAAWKLRGALHEAPANHDQHVRLLFAAAMMVLFGYFCISSFVRARRRERQP
jgi:hypothetical protein